MKQLKNILIFEFILCLVLYFVIVWAVNLIFSNPIEWLEVSLIGVAVSFFFSLIGVKLLSSALKPVLSFLDSPTDEAPAFGDRDELVFEVEQPEFSFEALKYKIAEKNVVTFFDRERKMLKFRTKISPTSFGIGGYVFFNADNRLLHIICFPLVPFTGKAQKNVQEVIKNTEKLANS